MYKGVSLLPPAIATGCNFTLNTAKLNFSSFLFWFAHILATGPAPYLPQRNSNCCRESLRDVVRAPRSGPDCFLKKYPHHHTPSPIGLSHTRSSFLQLCPFQLSPKLHPGGGGRQQIQNGRDAHPARAYLHMLASEQASQNLVRNDILPAFTREPTQLCLRIR